MNKKILMFLIGSIFLIGCGSENIDNLEDINNLKIFLSNIYLEEKFEVIIKKNNEDINDICISENSYFDKNTNLTYYKYLYEDGYQIYDENSIKNEMNVSVDYVDKLNNLKNVSLFNDSNFDAVNNYYEIKKDALSKFDFSFLQDEIETFKVYYDNSSVVFDIIGTDNDKYSISLYESDREIYPFNVTKEHYESFYENTNIEYKELEDKIENDDFVLILTNDDCFWCQKAREYLYLFQYECNYNQFQSINIKNGVLDENQLKNIISKLQQAYHSDDNKYFFNPEYSRYPDGGLTPTLVRFINGNAKYVKLGVSATDGTDLKKICFD